jgi:hypothetical protein
MNSAILSHQVPTSPDEPTVAPLPEEEEGEPVPVKLKSAVVTYIAQWFAYLLTAGGALFVGAGVGTTITELITGTRPPSSGLTLTLTTYRIFALPPDQAFASLAVLVVVVFTLSAGFRDSGVTIEPEVAYVRYRVQAWLLALTGVCCNAIVLMLLIYTALNWGSTDGKFQTALLPLALATAIAASLLSVGRERQMELEAMMLHRGILKLEDQHRKASHKWDRHWKMSTDLAGGVAIPLKPFFVSCLVLTGGQLLVLTVAVILGLASPFSLLLAPVEIAFFCGLPVFAVMSIVANILRHIDVMERFSSAFPSVVYLVCVASTAWLFVTDPHPEKYLPHLVLPALAGLTLVLPLLLPIVRRSFEGTKSWTTYAWFGVHDLQRARELKTELLRRERTEKRIEALKSAWRRRSSAHLDAAK